jgi:ATP synthase epsilon subunit.
LSSSYDQYITYVRKLLDEKRAEVKLQIEREYRKILEARLKDLEKIKNEVST